MSDPKLHVGDVINGAVRAASLSRTGTIFYVLGMGAVGTGLDILGGEDASNMPYTIASVIAGYFLLHTMLLNTGTALAVERGKRLGAYFGLSLVSGIAILLGFALLIIPGIILTIRWLPAFAILLAEDTRIREALSESWDRTRGQFWPLFAAGVMMVVLFAICISIYAASELPLGIPEAVAIGAGNLALAFCSAAWTAIGVSAYRLLSGGRQDMAEAFA